MHTRGEETDTGAVDARGGRAGICTQSAAQWQSVCERLGSDQCAGLSGDDASQARSLLALQLEALPSLRAMIFQRGPWALRPVSELEASLLDGVSTDESLAVSLVAQSFAGCTDTGLLAQATTSSLCENAGTGSVNGVAGAQCAALDGPCQRGYFDEARGCCDIQYSVEGASCIAGTTAGVCDAAGGCGSTAEYAPTNAYAWSETLPTAMQMRRVGDWYLTTPELAEDGSLVRETINHAVLRMAYTSDGSDPHTASGNVEERGVIRVPATSQDRITLAVLHAASEGVDGVLVHTNRPGVRTLLIDRRPADGEQLAVTITRASMATLGYLGADGTTIPAGLTEVVDCAGTTDPNVDAATLASDEVRCTFTEEGLIAVEGEAITAAYVAVAGAEFDVRPAGYFAPRAETRAGGVDPRIVAPPSNSCNPLYALPRTCTRFATQTCPAGTGSQTCQSNGQWGPCVVREVCNGIDDNCDGTIDESGATMCNDGMSCTVDSCGLGGIYGVVVMCKHQASPAVCRRGGCTTGICNGVVDYVGPSTATTWTSPQLASGCSYRESDYNCEYGWDKCNCNGLARCEGADGPFWNGFKAASNCTGPACGTIMGGLAPNQNTLDTSDAACHVRDHFDPLTVGGLPPNPPRNGGCETDGNVCTIDDMCFEPDPENSECRFLTDELRALQQQLLDVDGFTPRSDTIDGLPVLCAGTIAGQNLPPSPFDWLCQADGFPCTGPNNDTTSTSTRVGCVPSTGRCIRVGMTAPAGMQGTAESNYPAGTRPQGDFVTTTFSFPGSFTPVRNTGCGAGRNPSGGTYRVDPFDNGAGNRQSCFETACNGAGYCGATANNADCNPSSVPGASCNLQSGAGPGLRCVGTPGVGRFAPDFSNVNLRPMVNNGVTTLGCSRGNVCWIPGSSSGVDGDQCWGNNEWARDPCLMCSPSSTTEAFSPRSTGWCATNNDTLQSGRCGWCTSPGICTPRPVVPGQCEIL